jgi:hypothetical protein
VGNVNRVNKQKGQTNVNGVNKQKRQTNVNRVNKQKRQTNVNRVNTQKGQTNVNRVNKLKGQTNVNRVNKQNGQTRTTHGFYVGLSLHTCFHYLLPPQLPLMRGSGCFLAKFFMYNTPLCPPQSHFLPTHLSRWNRHSVPNHWHLKYRCQGITPPPPPQQQKNHTTFKTWRKFEIKN